MVFSSYRTFLGYRENEMSIKVFLKTTTNYLKLFCITRCSLKIHGFTSLKKNNSESLQVLMSPLSDTLPLKKVQKTGNFSALKLHFSEKILKFDFSVFIFIIINFSFKNKKFVQKKLHTFFTTVVQNLINLIYKENDGDESFFKCSWSRRCIYSVFMVETYHVSSYHDSFIETIKLNQYR